MPPSASMRRSELARPISTGMTAPGNSTRLRKREKREGLGIVWCVIALLTGPPLYDASVDKRYTNSVRTDQLGHAAVRSRQNLLARTLALGAVRRPISSKSLRVSASSGLSLGATISTRQN